MLLVVSARLRTRPSGSEPLGLKQGRLLTGKLACLLLLRARQAAPRQAKVFAVTPRDCVALWGEGAEGAERHAQSAMSRGQKEK